MYFVIELFQRSFAFIEYESAIGAKRASELKGSMIDGRAISIELKNLPNDRCMLCKEKGHKLLECELLTVEVNSKIVGKPKNVTSTCFRCEKRGHRASDCPKNPAKLNTITAGDVEVKNDAVNQKCELTPKINSVCFLCEKKGHRALDCPKRKVS